MNLQNLSYAPSDLDFFGNLNGNIFNTLCSTTIKVETPKGFEKTLFTPKRIVKNGVATIVFWQDGTKTIVKRAPYEPESDYAAFTAALGIKCFGSNSALKRIVERTETQKPKKQKRADEANNGKAES